MNGLIEVISVVFIFIMILFILSLFEQKNNEKKEFKLLTKFKISLISVMVVMIIYLDFLLKDAGFDIISLGIIISCAFARITLILILAINFIVRIYYRVKYKQKFTSKEIIICGALILLIVFILFFPSLVQIWV